MKNTSERLSKLAASKTIEMSQKSRELKNQGKNVINLSLGEPDFNTPDHIKLAAKTAIDQNYTTYSPVPGYQDLRQAISNKLLKENGLVYSPEQIVVSNGAKHSLMNTFLSLVNPGEEVIIPAPYWVSYIEQVKLTDGVSVIVEAGIENDFKITAEQLENAITEKTKLFLLCSPSNPTGSVYSRNELEALKNVLVNHPHVYILSDEIYEHINFSGTHESIAQFPELKERVIIINGVSKAFAMTGWRIGYSASEEWLAKAISKVQGQMTSGPSSIAQRASLAALEGGLECVEEMKVAFDRRRKLVLNGLSKIEGLKLNEPTGAFYVFPDISSFFGKTNGTYSIESAKDLCMYLLETEYVAMVPGCAFGSPNCLRISYAASDEQLIEAIERIKRALGKLN